MIQEIFRRRYFISLSYLLIAVVGFAAWLNIPLEMAPDMSLPSVTVSYTWGSASPEVMEQEITRQVEQAAMRLRNVEQLRSVSEEGVSRVTVTFEKHAPVEYRVIELREYLHGLRATLPPQLQPVITRSIPQELQEQETFMAWSLSGERSNRELYEIAGRQIRMQLLALEGLSDIDISGAEDPALSVRFDTYLLERYGLDQRLLLAGIQEKLQWHSAGYSEKQSDRVHLLVPPQFDSLDEIRGMEVEIPGSNRLVRLEQIARVAIEDFPVRSVRRMNGNPAVTLTFVRESGSDAISLASGIRTEMERIQQTLPEDIHLQLERDSTEDLRAQFDDLQYQSIFSLLVVFIILLLFIRSFRAPFVILGSILFSLLMSVSILFFMDHTMNVLTLAGLTVALGMIIDNAVVVFEQINPRLPAGREERIGHVRSELPHTLVPVFGSTLTTVGIFLPLMFAMEELQIFLVPLAVALTLTLLSSVLVAMSWIPYSLIWLVPSQARVTTRDPLDRHLDRRLDRWLLRTFHLRHRYRWAFYLLIAGLIGLPLFAIEEPDWEETRWPEFSRVYFDNRAEIDPLVGGLTSRFFDEVHFGSPWQGRDQEVIFINIRTPQGTPIEEIDKIARRFESIASQYENAFDFYETHINEQSGAQIRFFIKNDYLSEPEPYRFFGEASFLAARTGNSGISVSGLGQSFGRSLGGAISGQRIALRGFSYEELLDLGQDIRARLMQNPRVQEVDLHSVGYGMPRMFQYVLELDNEELALRGLDRSRLQEAIQLDVNPTNIQGRVELEGRQLYLMGRSQGQTGYEEDLRHHVRRSGDQLFTLDEVGDLYREQTLPRIIREDQAYQRTLTVDFLGPYRMAQNVIETTLDDVRVPVGASIEFGSGMFAWGQDDQTRNYLVLFLLTVLCVWMIVSALLESWNDPLVVILAVPLSLIGVMAGALWHGITFGQGAIAGTLLAVGVVVNNAILLIHEKQSLRRLGVHGYRSWVQVYRRKMRVVLITSLTTIGGLLPMVWVGSSDFWNHLAIVVIWGLAGSLVLLLLSMGMWESGES
ncbi:MAG: efflux RND transporter permease subunit [Balneolaceae bacterium]